jgi:outer membrane protein, adhesin transport system
MRRLEASKGSTTKVELLQGRPHNAPLAYKARFAIGVRAQMTQPAIGRANMTRYRLFVAGLLSASALSQPLSAQDIIESAPAALPEPSANPLAEQSDDPILSVADTMADEAAFHRVITQALAANPTLAEGLADRETAEAQRRGARSGLFPRIDLAISGNKAIARDFSNDPDNIIERARGGGRVDANASLEQILVDFGATSKRIRAASERIVASNAEIDRKSEAIALNAIAAWYDLFAYSHLVELADHFIGQTETLRGAVEMRISQGAAAPVERARVDSALASARLRRAQYGRELANARARFTELFSLAPPIRIARAPAPELERLSDEALIVRAQATSQVRVAEASARAARSEARAARADTLPSVVGGVDAGRFGLFQDNRTDYDIRGRLTLRYRMFGPGDARADEARSRADAAEARADSVRLEAEREARIAWSDAATLDETLSAYRADYLANRVTRDAVLERFRLTRGTLFDALDAQDRLFLAAANYIRALSERDAATYVALARSGDLLRILDISPAGQEFAP